MRSALLICGILAALFYVATDIAAGVLYPSYSFSDQAVSELFAIGAPTSGMVVAGFNISSLLLMGFAFGVWTSFPHERWLRRMAVMFGASAVVGMVLWNVFPMHMRGAATSFTDTMHLILATNPFVVLSIGFALIAFRGGFRLYTGATILVLLLTAVFAFQYAPALQANLPTPGLGLSERVAQYAFQVWQVVLVLILVREANEGAGRGAQGG